MQSHTHVPTCACLAWEELTVWYSLFSNASSPTTMNWINRTEINVLLKHYLNSKWKWRLCSCCPWGKWSTWGVFDGSRDLWLLPCPARCPLVRKLTIKGQAEEYIAGFNILGNISSSGSSAPHMCLSLDTLNYDPSASRHCDVGLREARADRWLRPLRKRLTISWCHSPRRMGLSLCVS